MGASESWRRSGAASHQRTSAVKLADIAPRLGRARDQLRAERKQEWDDRRQARADVVRLEALAAHRELQTLRAAMSGSRGYYRKRDKMQREAEGWLAGARRRLRELER